ncbi:MAG: ketopantoate reductase family protein [Candidatus Hodarchaeales archaeon]|jgi:2-dehydropantoate 2-reductase
MSTQERIFILGSGAIGIALAVNLINNGRNVILVRTSVNDLPEEKIEVTLENVHGEIVKNSITVVSLNKLKTLTGIIAITTKSHVNDRIAVKLGEMKVKSPLVIMQNGIGVENSFINRGFSDIYRCILFVTSQSISEYYVRYRPIKPSLVGIIKGDNQKLQEIVDTLNTPKFEFVTENKIQEKIWVKGIINSVFNSICPLLDIDNGIFIRSKVVTELASDIIKECIKVSAASGVTLEEKQILQQILNISEISTGQLISTLQDIRKGRKTEIESLNIEIARIAAKHDLIEQIEKTELLGKLVLIKSDLVRNSNNE